MLKLDFLRLDHFPIFFPTPQKTKQNKTIKNWLNIAEFLTAKPFLLGWDCFIPSSLKQRLHDLYKSTQSPSADPREMDHYVPQDKTLHISRLPSNSCVQEPSLTLGFMEAFSSTCQSLQTPVAQIES